MAEIEAFVNSARQETTCYKNLRVAKREFFIDKHTNNKNLENHYGISMIYVIDLNICIMNIFAFELF